MEHALKFWDMIEHFMEVLETETGFPILIYDTSGHIVRATDKTRIGDLHAGSEKMMREGLAEYIVTPEEAANDPQVPEGCSCPIVIEGQLIAGLGITGKLSRVKPLVRIAVRLIGSWMTDLIHRDQLKRSERKYRDIFDHSSVGIFQSTIGGRLLTANKALAKMYGYDSPDHLLERISDLASQLYVDPEDRDRLIAMLEETGSVSNFSTQFRRLDGQVIQVSVNAHFLWDPESGDRFIEGIVEDVTEKNKALRALRLSEEKYFKAFNSSPVWVVLSSMKTGRYIEVNETFLRAMGYTRKEVIGRTSLEIEAWENPEDRKRILNRIETNGFIRNYEVNRVNKAGETLTMLFSAEVIEISGEACLLSISQDITTRKQAEEDLRLSENNLQITLDSIGDAVITTDTRGIVTRMNPMAERLTGWRMADAVGRQLPEVFHIVNARTRDREADPAEIVMKTGKIVGLANHTVLLSKTGKEFQIADSGAPIRGGDGSIAGVVLVFRDVTKAYAQAQKIRESQQQLKNINVNLPGVVYEFRATKDHTYAVRFVSEKSMIYFGLDASVDDFFERFYACIPDPEKEGFMNSIREAVDNVHPWHYEGRFIKPSGNIIWFSGRASEMEVDDAVIYYGVLLDITDTKNWQETLASSERRYRDLFNEAPVVYVITENRNDEPYIKDVNNRFSEVLGYGRDEVINTSLMQYYTEESVKEVFESGGYQRALTKGIQSEERFLVSKDGRVIHTLLRALPQIDGNGKVTGTRAMYLDITAHKQAEEQARLLETALVQAQKMEGIGTLAGGIAHDFNNILAAVIGYSELLLAESTSGSRQHRNLSQILTAGNRARELVNQILTFSRQNERELKPLQIKPMIKEAMKLLRSSFPSTIEIHLHLDEDLGNVLADATQIHQIVMNLCTNAAHAMAKIGGTLTVRLSAFELEEKDALVYPGLLPGRYNRLTVGDTGTGIPDELVDRIFDPYFTTKDKGEGTGLGLSVVHGIVQSYGGTVHVKSTRGRGTTFQVYIPSIQVDNHFEPKKNAELPLGSERILFVDDEPTLVDVACQMLDALGYQVTACNGSQKALEAFEKAPLDFDLVISDLTMPKMTGDKLATELIKIRPDLPVILCTGFGNKLPPEKASQIGIKRILKKPLAMETVAHVIREVLDGGNG